MKRSDTTFTLTLALALSTLALAGCSDDDEGRKAGKPSENQGGGGAEPAPLDEAGMGGEPIAAHVYALTTQVFGETEDTSYVLLTSDLDAHAELSIDDAVVEIAGRALGTGPEGSGLLFVAGELGPTITRYQLNADGRLQGGASVSFLTKGVTKFGEYGGQFQYIADDKAYWFDGPTAQVVVWNPSAMKVTGTIPLTELAADSQVLSFTAAPIRQGDKLYQFAAWREGLAITPRAAIVVIDTKADTAKVVEDTRCGFVRDGVLADDDKIYAATEAFGSAAHFLDPTNPTPCLLRFDPTDDTFDEKFDVELSSLFGGAAAGSLVVGPVNQPFLRVLDQADLPDAISNPRVLASAPFWSWYKLTAGDEPVVEAVEGAELAGGSVLPFKLGNRTFAPIFVDGEETQFLELSKEGPVSSSAMTIPGLVFSAVKLK